MLFKFGEYEIDTKPANREIKKSLHTGNELETLEISLRVDRNFETPEFIFSDDKKWKVNLKSSSYVEGSSIKDITWKLEEIEEFEIEKLVINDVKFKPYFYKEEINHDNKLSIKARIKLDKDEWSILNDLIYNIGNVSVIREGISDNEIKMRFGKTVWSENEEEYKCNLNLFPQDDDSKSIAILQPEMRNIENILLRKSETINKLLSLLVKNDIINESEKNEILEEEKMDFSIFDKTKDVDEFFEKFM